MEEETRKTSEQWYQECCPVIILDPDGWDRENYQYSWYEELITFDEFSRRVMRSTCLPHNK